MLCFHGNLLTQMSSFHGKTTLVLGPFDALQVDSFLHHFPQGTEKGTYNSEQLTKLPKNIEASNFITLSITSAE